MIEEAEGEMIYSVFDFAAAEARKVMIPRAQVAALSATLTVEEALAQVLDAPFTCHPVYDGDLNHVVGVLYLRDLFTAAHRRTAPDATIAGAIAAEYDLPDESVDQLDSRTVPVSGTFPIDDFNTRFGVALPQTRLHTLAGLTFDQLGRVAVLSDELRVTGVHLRVSEVDGPRIRRLQARFPDNRSNG